MNLRCFFFLKSRGGENEKGPLFGCRHVQMVFYFFLMTFTYCMRSVLSVAIVAMNDPKTSINKDIEVYDWDNQSVVLSAFFWGYVLLQVFSAQLGKKFGAKWMLSCILVPVIPDVSLVFRKYLRNLYIKACGMLSLLGQVYDWDNQSVVLSAFFWGYVLLQVPSAQLGKKFGAKWMLVGCTSLDSLSCILIPVMASRFGSTGVMICRVSQGLAQGGVAPLVHTLLGCWAPPSERSVMATVAYTGGTFGIILCLPITGVICSGYWGWPASFYLFGSLGLMWALAWSVFGADTPSTHKTISNIERKYIETSLGQIEYKVHHTPWRAILKSPPFWAVTLAFVGANWGSSILLTQTPTYLNKILNYDIKSNSLLSAAPYLAMMVCSFSFSPICDKLINNKVISRGTARKIFNSIGMIFPAISLTIVGFIPKGKAEISVALLILTGGVIAGGFCGFQVNHVDLSPNHSGIMMGITNSSTSVFSILSPLIVQFIVSGDQTNQSQWRTIFLITACVYLAADLFFIIFASGEIQPWNDVTEEEETNSKTVPECPSTKRTDLIC